VTSEPFPRRDESSRANGGRALAWVLLLVVAVGSLFYAYAFSFTTFRIQDDEGYFLLALRAYRAGQALYDRIDTVYGPFYFQATDAALRLAQAAIDSASARWFTIAAWICTSLFLCRHLTRATGSFLTGILAYFFSFSLLGPLVSGPMHPGALDVMLLSAVVIATLGLREEGKRTLPLLLTGALLALLTLSKLNAGAFGFFAFAALFARFGARGRSGAAMRAAVSLALCAAPLVLIGSRLGDVQFLRFALIVSLSIVPLCFVGRLDQEARDALPLLPFLFGAVGASAMVIGVCLFQGTTWSGLWRSLVLGTLGFSSVPFAYAPQISLGAEVVLALAAVPVVFCARASWMAWFSVIHRALFELVCGFAILALSLDLPVNCTRALPLVWLVAVPRAESRADLVPRTILAWLVVLESLHAYPVAGNQTVLFAVLVPVAGLWIVHDAWRALPSPARELLSRGPRKWIAATAVLFALGYWHALPRSVPVLAKQFRAAVPLDLPGTPGLRLPERRVSEMQWVAKNLEQNGRVFLGAPGLHSFYFWTSLTPPVPFYTNAWLLFFDAPKQEELVNALLAADRPCIVRNRAAIEFWTGASRLADGPARRAIDREFRSAGAVGEYELLLPNAATPDLVLSILSEPAPSALRERLGIDRALRLSFPAMPGIRVTRVVARDTRRNLDLIDSSDPESARRAALVDARGEMLLRPGSGDFIDLSARSPIYWIESADGPDLAPELTLVRAYDASGLIVARLLVPSAAR
jgi:hypothetical protein